MSASQARPDESHAHIRAREAKEFRLIFLATFPLFLIAGVVARALSRRHGHRPWNTVISEARAAANTCIPFVFMR